VACRGIAAANASHFDTSALANRPAATLNRFDPQQLWSKHSTKLEIATLRLGAGAEADFIDAASLAAVSVSLEKFVVGAPLISRRACPARRMPKPSASSLPGA
jgi:hypothetical protein